MVRRLAAAALAGLLHRWTGSSDLTFGFRPTRGREAEFSDVIGPCLNTVVVRSTCGPQTTGTELLETIRDGALEAIKDFGVPFGAIVDALNPPRSAGSTPYLDVMLAPQVISPTPATIGDCAITALPVPASTAPSGSSP